MQQRYGARPPRLQHGEKRRRGYDGRRPLRPRPWIDVSGRRPPQQLLPENEERRLAVDDERSVRKRWPRRLVPSLRADSIDPLRMKAFVERIRPGRIAGMSLPPQPHEAPVVLMTAERAGTMTGGE